jgi:hypothetical protein
MDKEMMIDSTSAAVLLQDYVNGIRPTDRLPEDDLRPVLMGLFGEVGSIMAPAKKLHREKEAYPGYRAAVEEEFGDALWYLTGLTRRAGYSLTDLVLSAMEAQNFDEQKETDDLQTSSIGDLSTALSLHELDDVLLNLGSAASALLTLRDDKREALRLLRSFTQTYIRASRTAGINLSRVMQRNLSKVRGRFLDPELSTMPTFDSAFHDDERLPDRFEIVIRQRSNGQSCLEWNGVFIGDPLSDNIRDPDGFRYHDVFHFAHAAILHWSPTFRALIRHKRKSEGSIEEAQDSGRAIVVEEGLTAWLFPRAKELNFFEGQTGVSFDLLKTVQEFVEGYEVEACPLKLWESAILQGYSVFRQVRAQNGGIIVGDRKARSISFNPLARRAS